MSTATNQHSGRFADTERRVWWVGALLWIGALAAVVVGLFLAAPG